MELIKNSYDADATIVIDQINCVDITKDWDNFTDSDDISKVYATVEEKRIDWPKYGTYITIQGIRNLNFWELSVEKRNRLQDEILALINPYAKHRFR